MVASSTEPKIAISKLQCVTIAGRRVTLQRYVAARTSADSISRFVVPVRQPSQVELITLTKCLPWLRLRTAPIPCIMFQLELQHPYACDSKAVNGANLTMEVDTGFLVPHQ